MLGSCRAGPNRPREGTTDHDPHPDPAHAPRRRPAARRHPGRLGAGRLVHGRADHRGHDQDLWRPSGKRSNHAKGVVVEGSFTPSKDAKTLSKAGVFSGAAVPVTVRFPTPRPAADSRRCPEANPHGLSIKFKPADGSEMDVVTNSLKILPRRDRRGVPRPPGGDHQERPGTAKPTPVEQFMAAHPTPRRRSPPPRPRRASAARSITASTPSSWSMPPASAPPSATASCRWPARSS